MMDDINVDGIVRKFEDPRIQSQIFSIKKKVESASKNFERRNRVTDTTIFLMLFVSLLYDSFQFGLNFIPFVGWILSFLVGIYAWLTFYVWTSVKGWHFADTVVKSGLKGFAYFLSKNKWIIRYVLPVIALIPIVNSIPEVTAGTILTLLIVKSEDYAYNKSQGRIDEETIKQGIEFFNLFRNV